MRIWKEEVKVVHSKIYFQMQTSLLNDIDIKSHSQKILEFFILEMVCSSAVHLYA